MKTNQKKIMDLGFSKRKARELGHDAEQYQKWMDKKYGVCRIMAPGLCDRIAKERRSMEL